MTMVMKIISIADLLQTSGVSGGGGDEGRKAPIHAGFAVPIAEKCLSPQASVNADGGDTVIASGDKNTQQSCGFQEPVPSDPTVPTEKQVDDIDRWCWPHSTAMNTAEIDTFTARLARFTDKGLSLDDGEKLADKLVARDRESDDRRLCLECLHLAGHGAGSWRCGAWQAAGVAIRARDAQLPTDFVNLLQRCDGFTGSN
jgi:hypothetical protein